MRIVWKAVVPALLAAIASAKNVIITVGGDENGDPTMTFSPQRVDAVVGDIVIFNFTAGNHTATQSTFAGPCIPAHDTNITINGFDSGPRDTVNGTAVTILSVPILQANIDAPFWFYDATPGACGQGAVGAINNNENGNETLAGFMRNAIRLNGTDASSSSSSSPTTTHTSTQTTTPPTSGSNRLLILTGLEVIFPLALLAVTFTIL